MPLTQGKKRSVLVRNKRIPSGLFSPSSSVGPSVLAFLSLGFRERRNNTKEDTQQTAPHILFCFVSKMKVSIVATALVLGGASAYQMPTRSTLRSLGTKTINTSGPSRSVDASMKMEDFGFFKGTAFGFDDIWTGEECISEVGLEKRLNKDGLRYKMNRTDKEADAVGRMYDLPGFTVNLPLIGETYLGPPKVANIWEALGFTATSNNDARQAEKIKAIEKARSSSKGVLNGPGAEIRGKWLEKYGYPRLVGSGGIFYADQLSTDKEPMGGFNMGKSGNIWPVPSNIAVGQYGGKKGWGMKKFEKTVDGLPKADL